ncbi:hypothetical protein SKAU_G00180410 [Synaphobranchus kaupii]|uniref:Ubiquitin-like domain-containing protein n=1 Tax=Synaphobranchus kaupii TaxID=118154 RepID=A0A9Q1J0P3_SYNKA|nr:hypothetical protein SKAU_G00180410 [Synaphobranchus kaupii]
MSALSPAVANGPSEQNGDGEQVWERPWSLEEIRKTSANWSLAADSGLFLFLQDFSQRMLSKTHEIEKQLDGLIRDTKATDCCLHTVFNDFLMLSNTQFIENRVYDEEVEEPVSKPEATERQPEQEKTREQKEAELIPKVQEAVNYGLRVLESAFEQLDIKAGNSDSEDEEVADRVEPILEPKDLYVDRPLPYLIGSQHFMEQDDVGLGDLSSEEMSIDSDRDSVIDSEDDKNDDQSDDFDQDEEGQGSIKKKSSITSDEDEEEEDEEEDSDIFGESDKDENEDGKSSTGPSSFADELAARIKGEGPSKPEEDRSSLKSSTSSAKKKSKAKKETKAVISQVAPDDVDDMFSPPKMEDEDYSPFGGKGGLFSGGRGLFDDDDEGDLFSDAPKHEPVESSQVPAAKDPVLSKSNQKIPTGAVAIFPGKSLFGSPANGSGPSEARENGAPAKPQTAPKQAATGGLFDDDEDEDDFFSGSSLKKSASAGFEKPKQKAALDLFGGDGDDEDDDEGGDIFSETSGPPPPKHSPKEAAEEDTPPAPEKKKPAGAISMFGPGTKNVLVEGLKRRQLSTSEESEKSEENVPTPDVARPPPKPAAKPQSRGLFSDDEDTQDLFSSAAPKSKTNQAKSASVQQPSKPAVSSGLFSDDEDQWMSSKPSEVKTDVKTGGMRGSNSAPCSLPSARAAQTDSLFEEGDKGLFTATKETSKKKSQRVSLLFEEEEDDEEGKGSLFGFQPPAAKSTGPDVKAVATGSKPPSRLDKEKAEDVRDSAAESLPQENVEPKKKPAGAVTLFGGIDVLGQKQDVAKPTKSPLEEPDKDDFSYRDSPPPMDEEPRAKKNVVSLFDDNDDEDEEEEEEEEAPPASASSQPAAKNTSKAQEQRTRTKSTRVFQDEELLFTQKLQKDNDPDVDLFSTSAKPTSSPPSAVKPGAPALFGDDDEDDLFSAAKPKASPKVAEKPRKEDAPVKPASPPVSPDAEANLVINPASLLPGAVPRIPGAVSVLPGLSPPSPLSPTSSAPPSPACASLPRADSEGGVSFDAPALVTTLQSANKGRTKGAGRRRPQTRAARQLAAQLSDEHREEAPEEEGGASRAGSAATTPSSPPAPINDAPAKPSALRLPVSAPAETESATPKKPPAAAAQDDLFGSDDLFVPVSKRTPSPKPKSGSPEQAPGPGLKKKEEAPTVFDDPGGDLFQAAKRKPAKKPKATPFLDEEDDDIFGVGKGAAVTVTKEPAAKSNPSKQDIFQDEKQDAPKKRKEKALDASLFDDNVDIFADLTATTRPTTEKKSKKKVETKSIFDDDMARRYRVRIPARRYRVRIPAEGLSVWSLRVLPVSAWVSSGYSGFLPQSKDMQSCMRDNPCSSVTVGVVTVGVATSRTGGSRHRPSRGRRDVRKAAGGGGVGGRFRLWRHLQYTGGHMTSRGNGTPYTRGQSLSGFHAYYCCPLFSLTDPTARMMTDLDAGEQPPVKAPPPPPPRAEMADKKEPPFFNEDNVGPFHFKLPCYDTMELLIETLTGTCFELRVSPFETVLSVKAKIQRLEGIPVAQQHLIWNNVELEDECSLHDYSIADGCTLKLVLAMRGGPINTRRVVVDDSVKEMAEYMDAERDEPWEKAPPSKQVTYLVYREGDQLNFFRVVDRGDGSLTPVSESVRGSSVCNLYAEEEDGGDSALGQQALENSITMSKMKLLKAKMENMNLNKKPKKTAKLKPRPPGGPRPSVGYLAPSRHHRPFRVLPQVGQSPAPSSRLPPARDQESAAGSAHPSLSSLPVPAPAGQTLPGDPEEEEELWDCPALCKIRSPPKVSRLEVGGTRPVKGRTLPPLSILANRGVPDGAAEEEHPKIGGVTVMVELAMADPQKDPPFCEQRPDPVTSDLEDCRRDSLAAVAEQLLSQAVGSDSWAAGGHRSSARAELGPLRPSPGLAAASSPAQRPPPPQFAAGAPWPASSLSLLKAEERPGPALTPPSRPARFRPVRADSPDARPELVSKSGPREVARTPAVEPLGSLGKPGLLASLSRGRSRGGGPRPPLREHPPHPGRPAAGPQGLFYVFKRITRGAYQLNKERRHPDLSPPPGEGSAWHQEEKLQALFPVQEENGSGYELPVQVRQQLLRCAPLCRGPRLQLRLQGRRAPFPPGVQPHRHRAKAAQALSRRPALNAE